MHPKKKISNARETNMKFMTKMFGSLRHIKCILDKRKDLLFLHSVNVQARCKSNKIARPKAIEINKYKDQESIGILGYCLLGVPVITFALGTWQVKRWLWKLDLIDTLKQRTSAEPISLPSNLDELQDKEYYRVKIKGRFLYKKEFLMGPRSLILDGAGVAEKSSAVFSQKSGTGYYVVTPFKLEDRDLTIMVNRGWIPRSHRYTYTSGNKMTDLVEIVGIIRGTEKRPPFVAKNAPAKGMWHYRDLDAMAKTADAEPVYIELLHEYSLPQGPIGGQTKIALRNEHFSYIVTWFALSMCTGYMWFQHFIRRRPIV